MTATVATLSQFIDGTISVELEDPSAGEVLVSVDILRLMVDTVNAGPIVRELVNEADRAHAKHGDTSMRSQPWNEHRRVSILTEELGEVARPLLDLDHGKVDELSALWQARGELVQLGAMVLDWIAALDARRREEAGS